VISKGIEVTEEAKVEAFETSKNIPRGGRKFSSSGGRTTAIRSAGEMRFGPSSFMSRQQEERAQKIRFGSSDLVSISNNHWIEQRCTEFNLWKLHKREETDSVRILWTV
jgi:hypothetical protein